MKEIFDDYINNAFGEYAQAEFKFRELEWNYKKYFPADFNSLILDIGIGRGEMLTCMKSWGYQNYYGIDISPSTVDFCKSIGLNCSVVDDTSIFLQSNQNKYSVITLLDVLEHIKKDSVISFLKALRGALRDDGVLIIQVPNLQAPDGQLHRYNDITHEVGYIEHSLNQVLITAGFNKAAFYGYETLISNNIKTFIIKLLRNLYWKSIRFLRRLNTNLNPLILNPVFFSVIKK